VSRQRSCKSRIGTSMLTKWGKALAIAAFCLATLTGGALAQGQLRFCLRSEPKTFDPLKVEDDASVAIRYLTGGVLVRFEPPDASG
jgi:hypothetical protein